MRHPHGLRAAATPGIVTTGLVLNLDAGNSASYPGSGTTWTDLSGNGNTGTLTNGPTYSSADGGSIVFDGTNDCVVVPYNSNLNPSNVSISAWFKRTSVISYSQFAGLPISNTAWNSPYVSYGFEFIGTSSSLALILGFSPSAFAYTTAPATASLAVGVWVNAVGTYDGSNSKIYINGSLITSNAETRTLRTVSGKFTLGKETESLSNYSFAGNISNTIVYNRALTAAEVTQNFNALRGRYGL